MAGEIEREKKERFTSNMAGEGERGKKERFTNNKRRAFGPPFTNKNHPDAYKGLDFAKGHTH